MGWPGQEATFSLCSFWWVEALARAGRLDEARLAFEKMLTYANHVGLYSEEIGPTGEQLGNFPQALTHLGVDQRRLQAGPPTRMSGTHETRRPMIRCGHRDAVNGATFANEPNH